MLNDIQMLPVNIHFDKNIEIVVNMGKDVKYL